MGRSREVFTFTSLTLLGPFQAYLLREWVLETQTVINYPFFGAVGGEFPAEFITFCVTSSTEDFCYRKLPFIA